VVADRSHHGRDKNKKPKRKMKNTNTLQEMKNDAEEIKLLRQEIAACKAAHSHILKSQKFINATRIREREDRLNTLLLLEEIHAYYGEEETVRCEVLAMA